MKEWEIISESDTANLKVSSDEKEVMYLDS